MAHILVVEDDESMNEILVETLEDEGHEVRSVMNGKDAIQRARVFEFDLVISDVRLPGMDGVETLAEIRKIRPDIRTIIITGYASADTPVRAIRLKINDYLFKPFSLDYFLKSVERALTSEAEAEEQVRFLDRLFSFLGRSKEDTLEVLVAERQETFRGLYLGIRSGYLNQNAAAEVYAKLEWLEDKFRSLLNKKDADTALAGEIQSLYNELSNRIAELEIDASDSAQNDGIVPKDQFESLYQAVRSSLISLDDLQYAPLLRNTPDDRFEILKELLELKHRIWPQLKTA